ncbi:peptidase S41 [Candidatus Methylomirabilis lanthanidiphila]|uniref:Peptidase S41 n=1 Tax=Candidatus Methylomirabilis lanthanidiphila TaxID=2211376 RepID=A0A564ZHA2_9BACT|nr:peptidase S41 [Candidatus Methylomirabilis lanthanidiphila]
MLLVGRGYAFGLELDGQPPSLRQALILAIQSHYVEEVDMSALQSLSVQEIVARLDRDSSLRKVKPSSLEFIRGLEQERSVSGLTMRSKAIGYLRIGFFGRRTVQDLVRTLEALPSYRCSGLILDLRDNPGGRVETALQLAGLFLPVGVSLGRYHGRGAEEQLYVSNGLGRRTELVVILINRGTASSAELLAGLFRYYDRARLVGTSTAGKVTVQAALPLDHRHVLFLTTGRYRFPDGSAVAATGLRPDDEVSGEAEAFIKAQTIVMDHGARCEGRSATHEGRGETSVRTE